MREKRAWGLLEQAWLDCEWKQTRSLRLSQKGSEVRAAPGSRLRGPRCRVEEQSVGKAGLISPVEAGACDIICLEFPSPGRHPGRLGRWLCGDGVLSTHMKSTHMPL